MAELPVHNKTALALAGEGISLSQVLEKVQGGTRTDEQIAKDGATVSIRQINALRHQLARLEACCRHVVRTGRPRKDDESIWRQATDAADTLLDGMV